MSSLEFLAPWRCFSCCLCADSGQDRYQGGQAGRKAASWRAKTLPVQDLTSPMLFDFLLAETAAQRGDQEIAVRTYLKLAKTTRDPRVAQRATEIALQSRQAVPALEAAQIWVDVSPDSVNARQTLAALLVSADRLNEARPHLEKFLASAGNNIDDAFMQLNSLLVRSPNKNAAFELVKQLAEPYPKLPEAHFAVSQAAWFANDFDVALTEMKQALALRPEWEMAAIYQAANIGAYVQCQRAAILRRVSQELSQSQRYARNLRPIAVGGKKLHQGERPVSALAGGESGQRRRSSGCRVALHGAA